MKRLVVATLLLIGCAAPQRLAAERALAAGVGAGASAAGAAFAACAQGFDKTCREVGAYSGAGALLVALSTGAAAFLLETRPDAAAPSPVSAQPGVGAAASPSHSSSPSRRVPPASSDASPPAERDASPASTRDASPPRGGDTSSP